MSQTVECLMCNNVQQSGDVCAACGAATLRPIVHERRVGEFWDSETNVVVVGGGAAAVAAVRRLRDAPNTHVTLITEEDALPYYRTTLPKLIVTPELRNKPQFLLEKASWYAEHDIEVFVGCRAIAVDTTARRVVFQHPDGERTKLYDRLVIATGGVCNQPPFVPVTPDCRIVPIRTLRDMECVTARIDVGCVSAAVIIGGGLSGMEVVVNLRRRLPEASVVVVEVANRILPNQLTPDASDVFAGVLRDEGVSLRTGTTVAAIEPVDARWLQVVLATGERLRCDLVCHSCGVRPCTELARSAGCLVRRGVVVDRHMRTSIPDVYACGDCAELDGRCHCTWSSALRQGRVAAAVLCGMEDVFEPTPLPYFLHCFVPVFSVGTLVGDARRSRSGRDYVEVVVRDGVMVGGILVGEHAARHQRAFVKAVDEGLAGAALDAAQDAWLALA